MPTTRRPSPQDERAARETRRLRAAELFAAGRSQGEVANELGVSRQSAHVWHTAWQQGGVDVLRSQLVDHFVGAGPGSIPITNPQRWDAPPNPQPAMPALAAMCPHVLVQRVDGGGIDLLDLGSAEVRQDVAVDGAAIVSDGDG